MDYLEAFLNYSFLLNKKLGGGKNPDSIYLAGFTENHIESLKKRTEKVLSEIGRPVVIVEFKDQTWLQAISATADQAFKSSMDTYVYLESILSHTDSILLVVGLSKCKSHRLENYARGLIKTLDDAHFKKGIGVAS